MESVAERDRGWWRECGFKAAVSGGAFPYRRLRQHRQRGRRWAGTEAVAESAQRWRDAIVSSSMLTVLLDRSERLCARWEFPGFQMGAELSFHRRLCNGLGGVRRHPGPPLKSGSNWKPAAARRGFAMMFVTLAVGPDHNSTRSHWYRHPVTLVGCAGGGFAPPPADESGSSICQTEGFGF
jgi:hypothetical protein